MEWTVEYCSNDQAQGWDLFQNKTLYEADNLAKALNVSGADDGTWDVGCALPTPDPTTSISSALETETGTPATTSTRQTTTNSPNVAMATTMPAFGGALAFAVAAVAAAL